MELNIIIAAAAQERVELEQVSYKGSDVIPKFEGAEGGDKLKARLAQCIPKMYLPVAGLTSFVGLEEVKEDVIGSVRGDHRNESSKRWDRLLLFGPTGSGKSHFARSLASHFKALLFTIDNTTFHGWSKNPDLFTKLFVQILMESSDENQSDCTVLLLENFDFWCESNHACRSIVNLLNCVQGYWAKYSSSKLLIMACSYQPWNLDKDVVDAFQKGAYIRPLDFQERKQLIERKAEDLLMKCGLDMTEKELREVTKRTERLAACEICEMVQKALGLQCRDDIKRAAWFRFNPRPLTKIDFELTLDRWPAGKNMKAILAKFEEFSRTYEDVGVKVGVPKYEDKGTQVQMSKRKKGDNYFSKIFGLLSV